jgi:hypothetical protein
MVDRWKEGSFSQEQSARFRVPELWTDTRIEKAEPASAISGLANKWKIMFARPSEASCRLPWGGGSVQLGVKRCQGSRALEELRPPLSFWTVPALATCRQTAGTSRDPP